MSKQLGRHRNKPRKKTSHTIIPIQPHIRSIASPSHVHSHSIIQKTYCQLFNPQTDTSSFIWLQAIASWQEHPNKLHCHTSITHRTNKNTMKRPTVYNIENSTRNAHRKSAQSLQHKALKLPVYFRQSSVRVKRLQKLSR
jgi:hypothetical protein